MGVGKIHNHRFFASVHSVSSRRFSHFANLPHPCYKPSMKEPNQASPSPFGYLFAFTIGIICMGAIMFFMRAQSPAQPAGPENATAVVPARQTPPPPQPNVFGSRSSTASSRSSTDEDFPVHDVTATDDPAAT